MRERVQGIIPPDPSDITEVHSLDSKPSRWLRLASSRAVKVGGAVVGASMAVAAVEMLKEADLKAPPSVVRAAQADDFSKFDLRDITTAEKPLPIPPPEFLRFREFSYLRLYGSFEIPGDISFAREDGRFRISSTHPRGWILLPGTDETNFHYNFREPAKASRGSSSVTLRGEFNPELGVVSGRLETQNAEIINPNLVYTFKYDAMVHNGGGVLAKPRYAIGILDSDGNHLVFITAGNQPSVPEGSYESFNGLRLGPEGTPGIDFAWPPNAAEAIVMLEVGGTLDQFAPPGGKPEATYDNLSFDPDRRNVKR